MKIDVMERLTVGDVAEVARAIGWEPTDLVTRLQEAAYGEVS